MIKDTHRDALDGMRKALDRLGPCQHDVAVIVEVRTIAELKIAIKYGRNKIARILLDNMTPKLMIKCVALCNGLFPTKASGNINLKNIKIIVIFFVNYSSFC